PSGRASAWARTRSTRPRRHSRAPACAAPPPRAPPRRGRRGRRGPSTDPRPSARRCRSSAGTGSPGHRWSATRARIAGTHPGRLAPRTAAPRSRSACPSLLSVLLALLPVPRRTPGHPVVLHAGVAERVGVGGVVGGVVGLVVGGVVVGR